MAPFNRSFAARVGGVFCKSKFKIIVVSFLRLMEKKLNSARPTDVKAARDIRYDDGILLLRCISSHVFFF